MQAGRRAQVRGLAFGEIISLSQGHKGNQSEGGKNRGDTAGRNVKKTYHHWCLLRIMKGERDGGLVERELGVAPLLGDWEKGKARHL